MLADLIEVLDAEVLERPRGLAIPIGKVVVLDQTDLVPGGPGLPADAVVLLIGASVDVVERLTREAMPGVTFCALVVRGELSPTVHDFALSAGAAVLRVAGQTSWNDVLRRVERIGPVGTTRSGGATPGSLDLFGIADTAASIAGGPVTVEDSLHRIIAYSADQSDTDQLRIQTLLHRRTPAQVIDRLRESGTLRTLLAGRDPVLLRDIAPGACPRLVVPIRSDVEVLGLMWAALPADAAALDADSLAGFVRCAARVATHLVQLDGVLGRVRRVEVEHLARLLHSGDESEFSGQPQLLPDGVHWVVAAALDLPPDRRTHAKSRVVHLLDRAKLTGDVQLIVGDLNDLLYTIVSARRADSAVTDRILGLFAEVPGVSIGLSSPAMGRRELPQARVQAERALSVARHTHTRQNSATFEDVWPTAALLRLATTPIATEIIGSGPVRRLQALDHENGTEYVTTLREYLLAGADTREAAARLNVHVNTVRYRLGKLRDECPVDLEDPLARLVITMQLTLLKLRQGR